MPLQMLFAPNELVARTMLVPPSKIGTPESPKQVPPLECSLMNSSLIELLLATRVVAAKNRVVVFHIKWHLSFEFLGTLRGRMRTCASTPTCDDASAGCPEAEQRFGVNAI